MIYQANEFTNTQWSTAQEKADFANKLREFIYSDYNKRKFTKALYRRLSQCFGHIAHYNQHGFWQVWFEDVDKQREFEQHMQRYRPYGDPAWTYVDVEKAIQRDCFGKH